MLLPGTNPTPLCSHKHILSVEDMGGEIKPCSRVTLWAPTWAALTKSPGEERDFTLCFAVGKELLLTFDFLSHVSILSQKILCKLGNSAATAHFLVCVFTFFFFPLKKIRTKQQLSKIF